jgi:uncharacterized OB-fold protein
MTKNEFKVKSKAQHLREMRDMEKCPECGRIQSIPREAGDDCENEDCECYVIFARKYLYWANINWG